MKPWIRVLPPLLLSCSLFIIYLRTLAPGLTWAHDGSDGGDLITAAATGGVPHPTGYPLYVLLARLFQLLPVGSLAYRTNLFSAIATALAALLVYRLVVNAATQTKDTLRWPAGLIAGYAFGLAPLVWSQAVITEVYALQALLTALVLSLFARPVELADSARTRLDLWGGLALGLAVGNHISTLLLLPVALILGSLKSSPQTDEAPESRRFWLPNVKLNRSSFARQLGAFGAGLLLYLLIPLRAMGNPPVNWGNAVNPERFWWLVSGQLYRSYYLEWNLAEIWGRIQAAAAILLQQFGLPGLVVGLVGLIVFGNPSRLFLLTAWVSVVFTTLAVIYSAHDAYVNLIPVCLSFAIWIGIGLTNLSDLPGKWSRFLKVGVPLLLAGFLAVKAVMQVPGLDASADMRAESFGREVLSVPPKNAVLFAKGDRAVFALWYFHFALGERPDVSVLAEDLLHFDWYQETLHATYPSLVVPGPFPWPETIALANPARVICYVQYSDHVEMECSQTVTSEPR